jgi:streptomycin 6-kinase
VTAGLEMPRNLVESLAGDRDDRRRDWAARLPERVAGIADRWALSIGAPFQPGGMTAWVAPTRTADNHDVVLKVCFRHDESEHEVEGLQLWAGNGTVLVHRAEKDDDTAYLLLERAAEDRLLAGEPEPMQDEVIAGLLRRLWFVPRAGHPFRPLTQMCAEWADQHDAYPHPAIDPGLERAGLELFRSLPATATDERLLLTDLHAENVLAAEREPWLVIDPKPYVGDPAYDPLQHMLNCPERLHADPDALIRRMADLCGVDRERLRLWLFARCVVESAWWPGATVLAARLAPG